MIAPMMPAEVERVLVADVEKLREDQETHERPCESQDHRHDETHALLSGKEGARDESREDAEDDCTENF